ncbi:MAG: DNA methyltransferase [Candidatus Magasanikbacteria bacterium]
MFWFILGRESLLSAAEIAAVLNLPQTDIRINIILEAEIPAGLSPALLITRLGGTVKIARLLGKNLSYDKLIETIVERLNHQSGKIEFGVSVYNSRDPKLSESLGKAVKRIVKSTGKNARYVYNREPVLSSVTVAKNGLDKSDGEYIIFENKTGSYDVAVTEAVQPFEEFSERDFGRPGRDDVSGMLPPKLAMMMINLAQVKTNAVVFDPFCGSGTIITEAALMGYTNLVGSDLSEKAISDTKKNIEWMRERSHTNYHPDRHSDCHPDRHSERSPKGGVEESMVASPRLFQADATDFGGKIPARSIDAIIAEPYMGKPLSGRESETQLLDQMDELKTLYLSAFKEFTKILKPKAIVVFIIPRFRTRNDWMVMGIKEDIKKLGFMPKPLSPGHDSLLYARSTQRVGREVFRFIFSK